METRRGKTSKPNGWDCCTRCVPKVGRRRHNHGHFPKLAASPFQLYGYNGANELTSVSGGDNQTWTLDGMGNLGPANTANQLASCGYDHTTAT